MLMSLSVNARAPQAARSRTAYSVHRASGTADGLLRRAPRRHRFSSGGLDRLVRHRHLIHHRSRRELHHRDSRAVAHRVPTGGCNNKEYTFSLRI